MIHFSALVEKARTKSTNKVDFYRGTVRNIMHNMTDSEKQMEGSSIVLELQHDKALDPMTTLIPQNVMVCQCEKIPGLIDDHIPVNKG